jgi:uroporphyrinogen decarboxylase
MSVTPCRARWKSTLTDRERFRRQMHYQSVDRCFNMEFGYWNENFREWDLFVKNGIANNADADRFFNFDRFETLGGVFQSPNVWLSPPFPSRLVEETATTKILMNEDGLLAEVPRDGHDTIPHYIKSSVTTPDDWKRVKEERLRRDDPARKIDVDALKKACPDDHDFPIGVNTGSMIGHIRNMLTMEGLAYACFDYPDMVEDMVETSCLLVEDHLDQVLPHVRFDFAGGWEDICCKSGPLVTVPFFRDVVVPRYKRIAKKLHAADIDLWYIDCDGDVRPILRWFLEAGVNCMFPYEVNSCVHPAKLLAEYGKELRIMGGVDKIELGKGPKAIHAYLETLVPLVERGGYIPFCDHRCPPNVKVPDYLYYLDLKEKMFGMK